MSDVKPLLQVITYSCDICGYETYEEVMRRQFVPMVECPSRKCKSDGSKGKLFMMTRASKFIPFQEVKLQEMVRGNFFSDQTSSFK